jgi:prolyl-tRNA editing enzyme YbaK/EbsC (Cys-tRNA(Pro) deacylase)
MNQGEGNRSGGEEDLKDRQEKLNKALELLSNRVEQLEEVLRATTCTSSTTTCPRPALVVRTACAALPLPSARLLETPSDYYSWPLSRRARCLKASTRDQLCKTILLENTHCKHRDCSEPNNSRFYAVIIQYTTKLQSQKVFKFVRKMNTKVSKKYFKFTLATQSASEELTGFGKNAICPIGMKTQIPIILSKRLLELQPPFMWLGGGEVTVKLGCDVKEFIAATKCYVADVVFDEPADEFSIED